eukprot:CAMPEP_0119296086 /NCGR_PEP_ID=MMETSP1329-20130426/50390_1 /TAXON_ID=114041 /ORGANISM="Genus nov. species nov., Strain RCC1024" /LENGTH=172 /DNA_ID=CAMNT_0007297017 /DNA_START=637 /DNA_END=1156 /DNA_ORIENTATION=+
MFRGVREAMLRWQNAAKVAKSELDILRVEVHASSHKFYLSCLDCKSKCMAFAKHRKRYADGLALLAYGYIAVGLLMVMSTDDQHILNLFSAQNEPITRFAIGLKQGPKKQDMKVVSCVADSGAVPNACSRRLYEECIKGKPCEAMPMQPIHGHSLRNASGGQMNDKESVNLI